MKHIPQYMRDAVLVLRTHLNPDDPCNLASDEIKAHLRAMRGWLDSYVSTAVDCIDMDASDYSLRWLRDSIQRDAARIRRDQTTVKGYKLAPPIALPKPQPQSQSQPQPQRCCHLYGCNHRAGV